MERAGGPEEIFRAAGEELARLGLNSMVFLVQADGATVRLAYSSHPQEIAQAVGALLGRPAKEIAFDIQSAEQIRQVIRERRVLFLDAGEAVSQALPGELKNQASALVRALDTRWAIEVPLTVEEKVIGLLVVHSGDLDQQDLPAITAFANQIAASWQKARLMQTWSAACGNCSAPRAS
jgi:GAF domain-containing protein